MWLLVWRDWAVVVEPGCFAYVLRRLVHTPLQQQAGGATPWGETLLMQTVLTTSEHLTASK